MPSHKMRLCGPSHPLLPHPQQHCLPPPPLPDILFLRQARVPQALISRPSCPCALRLNLLPTLSCLDQPHLIFKSHPQCLFLQEVFPDNHKFWPGPPTMGSHSFLTSPISPQNCFEMAYLTAKCICPVRLEALRGQSPVLLY